MKFNLNEFLSAVANLLDIIEIDLFGIPTNHSKRIAFISIRIAKALQLSDPEIFDIASLALLHDNGASLKVLHDNLAGTTKDKINLIESRKEHCIIGDDNLEQFPFLTNPRHIILYHHEKYDGSGFFGLKQSEIPFLAQIIALADTLDLTFDLRIAFENRSVIQTFVAEHKNSFFSPELADVFMKLAESHDFWNNLSNERIDASLKEETPHQDKDFDMTEIRTITKTFSRIIDAKSKFTQEHSLGLSKKIAKMADYYHLDVFLTQKLLIAADLHDLGKLVVSNKILDKPGSLTEEEFLQIKKHPWIARECLQHVNGFEEIAIWIGNHHEKMDGSGYPNGLCAKDIDFSSRLLACLDIYQALRELRPYRNAMDHVGAMAEVNRMVEAHLLDPKIVSDIDFVFQAT
ncbi:MAG: HD family phosphohydrolase [Clostridiales bacterium]|nr:HD family phosphohydrolase [Clostridiales bacterium]